MIEKTLKYQKCPALSDHILCIMTKVIEQVKKTQLGF